MGTLPLILPTDTPGRFQIAVDHAVRLLKAGQVVALPTETVYGLAANVFDQNAVERIFALKKRPLDNPLIVHIGSFEMLKRCAKEWPEVANLLAKAFWPGPLTLVLRKSEGIPGLVTCGGETVAVRWPSHPFFQAVVRACGFPIAAPSANLANQLSPTTSEHVAKSFGAHLPLIIDGGACQVGIESTVVDVTVNPPNVLRPGIIHEISLVSVMGQLTMMGKNLDNITKSPGMKEKHYAPHGRLLLKNWDDEATLQQLIARTGGASNRVYVIAYDKIPASLPAAQVSVIPHDVQAYARAIYGELHRCDAMGAEIIVVEKPPETAEWRGILDRLQRAESR